MTTLVTVDGQPLTAGLDRTHLFVGAVVLLRGTDLGALLSGLLTRIYPDDECATDRDGSAKPFYGTRPFIDAMTLRKSERGLEAMRVSKVCACCDLLAEDATTPCYVIVTRLETLGP